ncbi:MAG: glycosyltransferase family 2 protein [Akkermansiaceae bacterium]|nr:glycosyltransferase family 2 protein [Armatimonadota bacterium]
MTQIIQEIKKTQPVTVLLCTAERGDSLVPTVTSILSATGNSRCDELLVIDQSADGRTEKAIAPFLDDPRLRFIRSATKGKGISLNFGVEWAKNEIIAITDDDVEVFPDWLDGHLEAFETHPKVALTYGQVLPVDFDSSAGFIPIYLFEQDRHVKTFPDKLEARGIGANTCIRRDVIRGLGGFDPTLGPGGKFFACVDGDMTVRCLIGGYEIYETHKSKVYHYGFRSWEQGRKLARNAWYGIGAAYAKPLRLGYWKTLPIPAHEFFNYALFPFIKKTLRGRPQGWIPIKSFLQGFVAGWKAPIDQKTLRFIAE